MPVSAAHPDAVKLDEAFAEAMNTPGKPREPGPPPEVDKDAPFGRDDDGKPLAPFGLRKDGAPKLSAAGRKPAEEQARVGEAAAPESGTSGGKGASGALIPQRYAPAIAETLEVFWLGGTVIGQAGPDLPLVGQYVPGPKIEAQAAVILMYRDNLAGALDLCAQHNEAARRLAVKLSSGQAGWALNAAFMLMPVVTTSLKVWEKEEPQEDGEGNILPTLAEQLADSNRRNFTEYMKKLAAKAAEAAVPEPEPAGARALRPG